MGHAAPKHNRTSKAWMLSQHKANPSSIAAQTTSSDRSSFSTSLWTTHIVCLSHCSHASRTPSFHSKSRYSAAMQQRSHAVLRQSSSRTLQSSDWCSSTTESRNIHIRMRTSSTTWAIHRLCWADKHQDCTNHLKKRPSFMSTRLKR